MKNCTYPLLLVMIGIASSLFAQPTLTYNNTGLVVGDNFTVHNIDISGLTAGNAGANQTWDFSGAVSNGTTNVSFVDPTTAPNGSSFPTANLATAQNSIWDFYLTTNSDHARVGADNGAQLIDYSDSQVQLVFPMGYQDMYVDSFAATLSGAFPLDRSGTITVEADAWGTLITPDGTYQNVLRIKYVEDYEDEFNGTPFAQYDSEIYTWYQPGTHYPIFSMTTVTIAGSSTTSYGGYLDAVSVDRLAPDQDEIKVATYPNPASDQVTVIATLAKPGPVNIALLNANGATLMEKELTGNLTEVSQELDLTGFPAGIYLLQISSWDKWQVEKLILQ